MAEETVAAVGVVNDDDTISVTSTISEVFSETREFEVESIVAERTFQGERKFLIAWLGYPEWQSTWEPKDHIQDDAILEAWDRRKQLEQENAILPFDVEKFEQAAMAKEEEKMDRHQRRKAKRTRLNMPVSSSEDWDNSSSAQSVNSDSSVEAVEVAEQLEDDLGMRVAKTKYSSGFAKQFGHFANVQGLNLPPPKPYLGSARPTLARIPKTNKRRRSLVESSSDAPSAAKKSRSEKSQRPLAESSVTFQAAATHGTFSFTTPSVPVRPAPSRHDLLRLGKMRGRSSTGSGSGSRGKTATRGGITSKKPRKLIVTSSDPKHDPKLFPNMRIRRRAELQARQIADGPPDLEAIGGLFDPSKPSSYQALKPSDIRRHRVQDQDADIGLFVDRDEPTASYGQVEKRLTNGSWEEIPYQATSKGTPPRPNMTTCFFWYKNYKDPKQKGCVNGDDNCERLHYTEPSIQIATPPAGYVDLSVEGFKASRPEQRAGDSVTQKSSSTYQSLVCFFWHKKEILGKSQGCSHAESHDGYIHDWHDGAVVASPPTGYSERDEVDAWKPVEGLRHEQDSSAAVPKTAKSSRHHMPSSSDHSFGKISDTPPSFDTSNPDHATCWFYDRGIHTPSEGGCSKGDMCKYFHFHAPGLKVSHPPPLIAKRLKFNSSSHASHNDVSADSMQAPQTQLQGSPSSKEQAEHVSHGLAQPRPSYSEAYGFNAICYDWHDTGICPVRYACKFIHTNDLYAPVAPKPTQTRPNVEVRQSSEGEKQRRAHPAPQVTKASKIPLVARAAYPYYLTCHYWDANGNCKQGSRCKYLHDYEDGVPIAPAPFSSRTCKFWLRGDCYRTAEECEYSHSLPKTSSAPEAGDTPENLRVSSLAPVRPRKSVSFAVDKLMDVFDEQTGMSEVSEGGGKSNQQSGSPFPGHEQSDALPSFRSDFSHLAYQSENALVGAVESSVSLHEKKTADALNPSRKTTFTLPNNSTFPHATLDQETSWQPGSDYDEDSAQLIESPIEYLPLDEVSSPELETIDGEGSTVQRTKSNMTGGHHLRPRIEFRGTGTKEIRFGHTELQSQVALATFGDIGGLQYSWAQQLSNSTRLRFDQMVLADDLFKQLATLQNERLWQGDLIAVNSSKTNSRHILDLFYEEMKIRLSGLISACTDFVILVYPKVPEWDFMETSNDGSKMTPLRFIIFRCNFDIRKPLNLRPVLNSDGSAADSGPPRKILVKTIHGLRLKEILPTYHRTKQNPWNFYLMLPSTAHNLSSFLTSWIHSSCRGNVYSSYDQGSWDFFLSNSESGVVFIHESCIMDIYMFPAFQDLSRKNITFWCISDSKDSCESKFGRISASLLMPHGHAFFLTPSFLLAEPRRVYEVLNWFFGDALKRGKSDTSTPGTWKLVSCHGLADYVLELANLKAIEKKAFEAENRDKPSLDQTLEDRGLDFPTCKLRYKIHAMLIELEARHIDINYHSLEPNFPDEQYNPIVFADPGIDSSDEKMLVEWFAAWALRNINKYRKFTVFGTDTKSIHGALRPLAETQAISTEEQDGSPRTMDTDNNMGDVQSQILPLTTSEQPIQTVNPQSEEIIDQNTAQMQSDSSSQHHDSGRVKGSHNKTEPIFTKIELEPTTVWYKAFKEKRGGVGYEHLFIEGWEKAFVNVGIRAPSKK